MVERTRSGVLVAGVRRRPAALVEVIGLLFGFLLFTRLDVAAGRDVTSATANARAPQSVERALPVNIEQTANEWLARHPALIQPAVYCHRLYHAGIVGVLQWAFIRHADIYVKIRRTLFAMAALALLVFWSLPVSPPHGSPSRASSTSSPTTTSWAATRRERSEAPTVIPSLHVGWSAWCA